MKHPLLRILLACVILYSATATGLLAQEQPNVLFIVCDDLNMDIKGYGGHPQAHTPALDSLMQSGMAFNQAHCNIPVCAPSRPSFLAGIYPHTSGQYGTSHWNKNPVLRNATTIPRHFKANGYHVIGTGKIAHNANPNSWHELHKLADYGPYAFDGEENRAHPLVPSPMRDEFGAIDGSFGPLIKLEGRDFGDGKSYSWRSGNWQGMYPIPFESEENRGLTADESNAKWAVEQLKGFAENPGEKPFFMAVGFMRPHTPLIVPQKYFDLYPLETLELPLIKEDDLKDTHIRSGRGIKMFDTLVKSYDNDRELALKKYVQAYLACVSSVDELIGNLVEVIDNSALKDNTIIIVTSDHGWHNGQKDHLWKSTLWQESTQVPLIFRVPGLTQPGSQSDLPVSLIDLFPTLIEKGSNVNGANLRRSSE
jgi:arylsulfatase A-like enzyme